MFEPDLTVFSDELGPRVEVAFGSLPVGAVFATIMRRSGKQSLPVRGAVRTRVGGALARLDYEVPFDVESEYHAVAFDASGVQIGVTGSSRITVAAEHPEFARIHNPLDPRTSVRVRFEASAVPKRSKHFDGSILRPLGRRVGVVASSGRSGYRGLVIDVIAETFEQSEKVDALFGDGDTPMLPVLCVRASQGDRRMRLPPVLFLGVLSPDAEGSGVDDAEIWRLTGDEVAPPVQGIVMTLLRRRDIAAFYGTRRQKAEQNTSRFEVSRRYNLAGVAG